MKNCRICNKTFESIKETKVVQDRLSGTVVVGAYSQCIKCSTLFTIPFRSQDELSYFYSSDYYSFDKSNLYLQYSAIINKYKSLLSYRIIRDLIRIFTKIRDLEIIFSLKDNFKTLNLLDFGGGVGNAGIIFESLGCNVSIYDISIPKRQFDSLKYIWDTKSLDVYDVIRLNHVVEHIVHPEELLRSLSHNLSSGGYIVVSSPNAKSTLFRKFGSAWWSLEYPRHCTILPVNFYKDNLSDIFDVEVAYLYSSPSALYNTLKFYLFEGLLRVTYKKSLIDLFLVPLLMPFSILYSIINTDDGYCVVMKKIKSKEVKAY